MKAYQITVKISSKGYQNAFQRGITTAKNEGEARVVTLFELKENIKLPDNHEGIFEITKVQLLHSNFLINTINSEYKFKEQ